MGTEKSFHSEQLVKRKTDYYIIALYLFLFVSSLIFIIRRYVVFRNWKGTLFAFVIAFQSAVRITYLSINLYSDIWTNLVSTEHGPSIMLFIDIFPELLFVDIYLLSVVTWAVAWVKAKGLQTYKMNQHIPLYTLIVVLLFLIAGALSIAAAIKGVSYDTVMSWEVRYLLVLTTVSVFSALAISYKLFSSLKDHPFVNKTYESMMSRLHTLIALTSVSFILKGLWAFSFSDLARRKWQQGHGVSDNAYAVLWLLYYIVSEILPEAGGLFFRWLNSSYRTMANERQRLLSGKLPVN